jgi:hypothetical protein
MLAYLNRLLCRMEAGPSRRKEKFYQSATEAEGRLQHLLTVSHYLGCAEVTGRNR